MPLKKQNTFSPLNKLTFFSALMALHALPAFAATYAQQNSSNTYYIQVAAYDKQAIADKTAKALKKSINAPVRVLSNVAANKTIYQVQVGPWHDIQTAKHFQKTLKHLNYSGYIKNYTYSAQAGRQATQSTLTAADIENIGTVDLNNFEQNYAQNPQPTNLAPIKALLSAAPTSKQNQNNSAVSPNNITDKTNSNNISYNWPMQLTASGYFGNNVFGQLDYMLPLMGDYNDSWYIDTGGQYGGSDTWLLTAGTGTRHVVNNTWLVGLYGFYDYNHTGKHLNLNVFNPGVEWMNYNWDIHLNGYLPFGSNTKYQSNPFFANQIGIPDYIVFNGHQGTDELYNEVSEAGRGTDIEIGRRFPQFYYSRIFLGGYYFNYPGINKKSKGLIGGFSWPVADHAELKLSDVYDTAQHNNLLVTISYRFGGIKHGTYEDIHDRMSEEIPRHLGALTQGNSVPIQNAYYNTGQRGTISNNIWFFSGSGGSTFDASQGTANCTYEHPCNAGSFTQANVNTIYTFGANTYFYTNPGTYTTTGMDGRITLNNGQSIFGRTTDYHLAASDNDRPLFVGGFDLSGNNSLNNFNLTGAGTDQNVGIYANGVSNIQLNNVGVSNYTGATNTGSPELGAASTDATGIDIENSQNITINNVTVSNIQGGAGSAGNNGSTDNNGTAGNNGGDAIGINLTNDTGVDINQVTVMSITGGFGGTGGRGGDGSSQNSNDNSGSGIAGEGTAGGAGGNGGIGGNATGILFSNTQNVLASDLHVENIYGGAGGNGGDSGNGGSASANNNTGNGTSGFGGISRQGGNGNNGGSATGIQVTNHSQVNISGTINNIQGGAGGNGGNGGMGGDATANGNGGSGNYDNAIANAGAYGGAGGNGGNGGSAIGIDITSLSQVSSATSLNVSNIIAGNGGNGGNGGKGGDSTANDNQGGVSNTANGTVQGGNGGIAGDGGESIGISLNNSTLQGSNISISNIIGGAGGNAGSGGQGGSADSSNNAGAGNAGGSNGSGRHAGNGGNAYNGGKGGTGIGLQATNSSTLSNNTIIIEHVTGGAGGHGGNGGNGGSADANNNGINGNGGVGGLGGLGGNGGDGGDAMGTNVSNDSHRNNDSENVEIITGGAAGTHGQGGAGGTANATNNGPAGTNNTPGSAGSAGANGQDGQSGTISDE